MRIVVDASAVGELIVTERREATLFLLLQRGDAELHAPFLCDVEVTSLVFRLERRRTISAQRALQVLTDYVELPIERHRHLAYISRVFELRNNFTAYDAMYVALCEALDASLLTADTRLASAARRHTAIDVLPR